MSPYSSEILTISSQFNLHPDIVAAQATVESGMNPWAWNPEPAYRYLWDVKRNRPFRLPTVDELHDKRPPADFPSLAGDRDQEWWAQQASWGLLQVMGAVAREYGFRDPYLTTLCEPIEGLTVGCHVLSALLAWAHDDYEQALAAYNGGRLLNTVRPFRNQAYVDRVLSMRKFLASA